MSGENTRDTGAASARAVITVTAQNVPSERRAAVAAHIEDWLSRWLPTVRLADSETGMDYALTVASARDGASGEHGAAASGGREQAEAKVAEYEQYEADARRILDLKSEALGQAEAAIERVKVLAHLLLADESEIGKADGGLILRALEEPPAKTWCKCDSCWGWFVEDHPGEDLDELGRDRSWWSGLPEHRDPPGGSEKEEDPKSVWAEAMIKHAAPDPGDSDG